MGLSMPGFWKGFILLWAAILLAAFLYWMLVIYGEGVGPSETQWGISFLSLEAEVSREGIKPARVLLAAQTCETMIDCEAAIEILIVALKPYRATLTGAVTRLSAVSPPETYGPFHDDYLRVLKLRLTAVDLYLFGAEQNDLDILAQGDDAWERARIAASGLTDRIRELQGIGEARSE